MKLIKKVNETLMLNRVITIMECDLAFFLVQSQWKHKIMRKTLRKISRYKKKEFHSSFTTTQKRPCHSFFELSITKKVFASGFCVSGMLIVVVSLACVSSKTHNLHTFFVVLRTQKGSLCQAFLAETVETGTKNHCDRS